MSGVLLTLPYMPGLHAQGQTYLHIYQFKNHVIYKVVIPFIYRIRKFLSHILDVPGLYKYIWHHLFLAFTHKMEEGGINCPSHMVNFVNITRNLCK
jgi:hypothetical protein